MGYPPWLLEQEFYIELCEPDELLVIKRELKQRKAGKVHQLLY